MYTRLFAWSLDGLFTFAFHVRCIASAVATFDILLKTSPRSLNSQLEATNSLLQDLSRVILLADRLEDFQLITSVRLKRPLIRCGVVEVLELLQQTLCASIIFPF